MIRAFAAEQPGAPLVPFEYDPGQLTAMQVEIKVRYCGICHSDISIIKNDWGMSTYPCVPGHEVIGVVHAIGSQVTHLEVGQTVGLGWHSGFCGHCNQCQVGDKNLCAQGQPTIVGHHGGFADYVRAEADSVVPLPDGMALDSAGPLFCGGITVFNPMLQFELSPQARVGVIGIGGLGHLALQFLRAWGCEVTAMTSLSKQADAAKFGAHQTIDSHDSEAIKQYRGYFDYILSTVNVALNWNDYLASLKPKGRLHFVGATLTPLNLNVFELIAGQRSVSGSPVGSPANISNMLDFAKRHQIAPQVEIYNLGDVNDAIEALQAGKLRYRAVLKV